MAKVRRLRPTIARQPPADAPEGVRAAWHRETVLKLSRPALASLLGLTNQTIARYEASDEVPAPYRLACAALTAKLDFDWKRATANVMGATITFGI